jgi:uncharacterized protein (TIGR02453 family)
LTTEYNGGMATKSKMRRDPFQGIHQEGLEFLKKLAKNNKREWFSNRKPFFEEHLQEPMTQLMIALELEMAKNRLPLLSSPKAVLSRIYRDIRFSADKSPYHSFVSGTLYRNGKKTAPGALYVHVGAKEQFAAIGFWQPERPLLTNWRLRMQTDPAAFLNIVKQLRRKKLEISDSHRLQRMPRGFEALESSPLAQYLRLQSFVMMLPISSEEVISKDLPGKISRFALDARPLLEYGWELPETKPTVFAD